MSLLPGASVKTKYDFTRCRFEWKRQFQVDSTTNIVEEGSVLSRMSCPVTGEEVVRLASAALPGTNERPCGIALISRISADTFTIVERVTVPAAAPLTVQLAHSNIAESTVLATAAEAHGVDQAGTPVASIVPGAPGGDEVSIDLVSGVATFNVSQAGMWVDMTYKWNLTAIERDAILRQSHINRGAEDQFGLMTVGYGNCWIYTTMFDAYGTYVVGQQVYTGDNGLFTDDVTVGSEFGTVISVPSVGDPYLGVEYISPA